MCSAIKCPVWQVAVVSCLAISSHFIVTSSDTLICEVTPSQEEIAPSVPKTKLVRRRPACAPVPLSVSYPRSALSRSAHFYINISIKHQGIRSERRGGATLHQEKDYPSAEDRTADYRTTINNSYCEAGPGEGDEAGHAHRRPPPF